jgi:hypothetical protein
MGPWSTHILRPRLLCGWVSNLPPWPNNFHRPSRLLQHGSTIIRAPPDGPKALYCLLMGLLPCAFSRGLPLEKSYISFGGRKVLKLPIFEICTANNSHWIPSANRSHLLLLFSLVRAPPCAPTPPSVGPPLLPHCAPPEPVPKLPRAPTAAGGGPPHTPLRLG